MSAVMIVDDEQWNRELIRTFGQWEALGLEVIGEAEDGLTALRLIEELSPRIVLTDMRMPGTDGVWLLENLSERYPDIQVIVISGYDDFAYTKHAVRHRAIDYLLKPIDPKELNEALARCKERLAAAESNAPRRIAALDQETVRTLSSLKIRIRHHFNDLSAEGLRGDFGLLAADLSRAKLEDPGALARIDQELRLLLSELLAGGGVEPDEGERAEDRSASSNVEELALALLGLYMRAMEQVAERRRSKNKLNLNEVRTYIGLHLGEPLSLEHLARVFFVSKEYLSKVFKQEFGMTVMDDVVRQRMEKAREWLLNERLSIKTVAEMAGYDDVSHFYRLFKKHYGMAPGEMRKQDEG